MKFLNSFQKKDLSKEIALLRVDFNIANAELSEKNIRLKSALPTIKFLINRGIKVVIMSHRGRPQPAKRANPKSKILNSKQFSLKPFAVILSKLLKKPVKFIDFKEDFKTIKIIIKNSPGSSIFLLENLRFLPGEEKNDKQFAEQLASLGNFYINDAFSVSHRANASVAAITRFLSSYAGLSLESEIKNLNKAIKAPKKPLVIILGGAKISDKIGIIKNFLAKADYFLIGGAMANTFMAAKNLPIGDSLYEKEMIPLARQLLNSKKIILPIDLVIAYPVATTIACSPRKKILDIGPKTVEKYSQIIKKAKTIIWNGPVGYIEDSHFTKGTKGIIKSILNNKKAKIIIGGGETTAFIQVINYKQQSNIFLSTGGGAMLEYLAGKKLPGIIALSK